MSYFYDAFSDFIIKNRLVIPDGEGGTITTWSDGATIRASLDLGDSKEIRTAQAQGLKSVFTITFQKGTPVRYGDYIESNETGDIYKITSEPKDNETTNGAKYPSCFATAVRSELPQ